MRSPEQQRSRCAVIPVLNVGSLLVGWIKKRVTLGGLGWVLGSIIYFIACLELEKLLVPLSLVENTFKIILCSMVLQVTFSMKMEAGIMVVSNTLLWLSPPPVPMATQGPASPAPGRTGIGIPVLGWGRAPIVPGLPDKGLSKCLEKIRCPVDKQQAPAVPAGSLPAVINGEVFKVGSADARERAVADAMIGSGEGI